MGKDHETDKIPRQQSTRSKHKSSTHLLQPMAPLALSGNDVQRIELSQADASLLANLIPRGKIAPLSDAPHGTLAISCPDSSMLVKFDKSIQPIATNSNSSHHRHCSKSEHLTRTTGSKESFQTGIGETRRCANTKTTEQHHHQQPHSKQHAKLRENNKNNTNNNNSNNIKDKSAERLLHGKNKTARSSSHIGPAKSSSNLASKSKERDRRLRTDPISSPSKDSLNRRQDDDRRKSSSSKERLAKNNNNNINALPR